MARYRITLEYDGVGMIGWQRQADGVSVQGLVEAAVFAFRGERVVASGGTNLRRLRPSFVRFLGAGGRRIRG